MPCSGGSTTSRPPSRTGDLRRDLLPHHQGRRNRHRGRPFRGPGHGSSDGTSCSPTCTCGPMTPTSPALPARVDRTPPAPTSPEPADQPGVLNARDPRVPRPWRLAFDAPADLPPLRHVLLGINAHVNYDLPQALLAVISDDDFADPVLMARRRRDHERIDAVLASRVAAEDDALGPRSLLDRVLDPLNRLGSKRFLKEARQKVWLQRRAVAAGQARRPGAVPQQAGRTRAAQRGEDRRSAHTRTGRATAGGGRFRGRSSA